MPGTFTPNPALDAGEFAEIFARDGRVTIDSFLANGAAEELHAILRGRNDWRQVINSGDKLVELDRPTRAAMSREQREALDTAVYAGARHDFQFRYETLRVPDGAEDRAISEDPLAAFAAWLSERPPREFLRRVTGSADITFADAQATAYGPGDFLTGHDDNVAGKQRVAAYVFGLTPQWRAEWGGLLLFHHRRGTAHAIAPGFNQLNLFEVGQEHSVSEVTRAAAYRRYSITGWLRR